MRVLRRRRAAQETGEPDLTTRRWQQIGATDDEIDLLIEVVDGNRELIRPVPSPIANQHVTALL